LANPMTIGDERQIFVRQPSACPKKLRAFRPSWSTNEGGRAVLMIGQPEIARAKLRFRLQTLHQCRGEARRGNDSFRRYLAFGHGQVNDRSPPAAADFRTIQDGPQSTQSSHSV